MKLTNTIRDAFINAAMDDVPQVDYQSQIQEEATNLAVSKLPAKVLAVFNDKNLRGYLNTERVWAGDGYYSVPCHDGARGAIEKDVKAATGDLRNLMQIQYDSRQALRSKLKGAVYSVSTVNQLRELLPEFEKYIPAENAPNTNLPAIAQVVTAFAESGWPKDRQAPSMETGRVRKAKKS